MNEGSESAEVGEYLMGIPVPPVLEDYEVRATLNTPVTYSDYPGPPDIPAGAGEDEHGEYGEDVVDFEEKLDENGVVESSTGFTPTTPFQRYVLEELHELDLKLVEQQETLEALKVGVNTIGEMMNG